MIPILLLSTTLFFFPIWHFKQNEIVLLFQDKLEAKLEFSQAELGKAKAELEKVHGDSSSRYNDYNDWRQKLTKTELEIDRMR